MSERSHATEAPGAAAPADRVFRDITTIPHISHVDDGAGLGPASIAAELARLRDAATWQHLFDASAAWRATASLLDGAATAITAAARAVAPHWDSDDAASAQVALRRLVGTARELSGAALETHFFLNKAAETLERAAGQHPPTSQLAPVVAVDTGEQRTALETLNEGYRAANSQLPHSISAELPEIDDSSASGWGARPGHLPPSSFGGPDRHHRPERPGPDGGAGRYAGHQGRHGHHDHLPSRPIVTMPVGIALPPDAPRPMPAPPIQVVATPEHHSGIPAPHASGGGGGGGGIGGGGAGTGAGGGSTAPVGVVTGNGGPPPSTVLAGSGPMMHGGGMGGMGGIGGGAPAPMTSHPGLDRMAGMGAQGTLGTVNVRGSEPVTMRASVEDDPDAEPRYGPPEFDHWESADRDPFGLRTTAPPPVLG